LATIYLLATSDIVTDQRVHRSAQTLVEAGHSVCVLGRRLKSTPIEFTRSYRVKLFNILFSKGVLFYLIFNLRAIGYLLFRRVDLIYANDLDTLLAGAVLSSVRQKKLIYDSHELYTELPELVHRKLKRMLWQLLERLMIPRVDAGITVSESVATELKARYGKRFAVVRNVPISKVGKVALHSNSNVIIYQGALNIGRGLEKLVAAMQYVENAELVIAGTGDIENHLIGLATQLGLTSRVHFTGRLEADDLFAETTGATLGVSLEEEMGLNYRYALPNKLFDYIQAGIPVLVSDMPEMVKVVEDYNVGQTIASNCSVRCLASKLSQMLRDRTKLLEYKENTTKAAIDLSWEQESLLFLSIVSKVVPTKKNIKPI